jgi:hypothetical protein
MMIISIANSTPTMVLTLLTALVGISHDGIKMPI